MTYLAPAPADFRSSRLQQFRALQQCGQAAADDSQVRRLRYQSVHQFERGGMHSVVVQEMKTISGAY